MAQLIERSREQHIIQLRTESFDRVPAEPGRVTKTKPIFFVYD